MRQKILHIIQDQKFPDSAYELFESVAPGDSRYLLPHNKKPIKYLNLIRPEVISRFAYLNPRFRKTLEKYDVVILHAMTDFNCELVARCSSKVNFLWIGLGYDYYDLIVENKLDMLEPVTRKVVMEHVPEFGSVKSRSSIKQGLIRNILFPNIKYKLEVIKKVKWFAPVLGIEFELLRASLGNPIQYPEYIDWNYALTAKLIESKTSRLSNQAANILVGNSASPFNNHFDVFRYISQLNVPEASKIIVPLSYGNNSYREKVIEEGSKVFGNQFFPVLDFMPFDEYMSLIRSCSIVIMNHNRQQAGGNITSSLYMGAKVFLNPNNYFYGYYKNYGARIYDIEQLVNKDVPIETALSREVVDKNREIIESLRARRVLEEKTTRLLEKVYGLEEKSCLPSTSET